MSRTKKDSARKKTHQVQVRLVGETYDILRDGEIERTGLTLQTVNDILCVGWGYCGQEFEDILREVHSVGQKTFFY